VYNGAFVYACWALHRSDFAWCGTTLTGSLLEIAFGLAQAKELGLIIGGHRSMIAHVRTCSGITAVDNRVVGNC
jgi:hypothetical protein